VHDLAAIQRRFYELVTAGEGTIEPGLLGESRRLDVYADMYIGRLHDVLADDYPKLRVALGEARFRELVGEYVRARPPATFTVRDVGRALPAYLASRDDVPMWSADLAVLERARVEVFDAADAGVLTRDQLAAVPLERFPELELKLVPAGEVVVIRWSVDELWAAIEDDAVWTEPIQCDRALAVWRRDLRVLHRTLDEDEAPLLGVITLGATIAEVSAWLAERGAPSPDHRMVELLGRWVDAELLRDFVRPPCMIAACELSASSWRAS
jgi:hypothetical protein